MDLFALERSIKEIEEKKSRVEYRPFLGVANFNTGKELIENKKILNKCKELFCYDGNKKIITKNQLYFLVLNTSLDSQDGEHWFLLAFTKTANTFYAFNSFGAANTLKTFGFGGVNNENQVNENTNRKFTLSKLCEYIWKKTSSPNNIDIVDINGIHQDFSTDECSYHVIRFVNYLYEQILTNNYDGGEINWVKTLNDYLRFYEITVVDYDYKYMVQEREPNAFY